MTDGTNTLADALSAAADAAKIEAAAVQERLNAAEAGPDLTDAQVIEQLVEATVHSSAFSAAVFAAIPAGFALSEKELTLHEQYVGAAIRSEAIGWQFIPPATVCTFLGITREQFDADNLGAYTSYVAEVAVLIADKAIIAQRRRAVVP